MNSMERSRWVTAQGKIAALTLALCAVPYLGIRAYLELGMHETAVQAALPETAVFGGLFVLGALLPSVGVVWIARRVLRDRLHFQLTGLLAVYLALIFIFASSYAILQASSAEASFSGMPVMWRADEPMVLAEHVSRLHDLFFESLYLSAITITTIGYGDLAPISRFAKVLTALEGLVGVSFMGIALGHYFSVCLRPGVERVEVDRRDGGC